jgi:general L-amino acid transport system permease protein
MLARLWYSERFQAWSSQLLLLMLVLALVAWVWSNTVTNLSRRGIRFGMDFLFAQANIPISESIVSYSPTDTFLRAYWVGLTNTLFISALAVVLSTLLGVMVALARRSSHPLLSGIAGALVTVVRNIPLIVHLLFWYALATTALPAPRNAWSPVEGVYFSLRGLYVPRVELGPYDGWFLLGAFALVPLAWPAARRASGSRPDRTWALALGLYAAAVSVLWLALGIDPAMELPALRGLNFIGGARLSAEFVSLMVGLVFYTSVFIGEIIRGGIDSVQRGQWEAGRALALNERQTLFRIIMPQALRVIIPPLTSQYLSTVKNSTLAIAVGFPELSLVMNTVVNQTGQAIESVLILLAAFLTVSLSVSLFMNWYNRRVALVTR